MMVVDVMMVVTDDSGGCDDVVTDDSGNLIPPKWHDWMTKYMFNPKKD